MTTRRRFTADFKAKVSLEALRGDRTVQEIAAKEQMALFRDMVCLRRALGRSEAGTARRGGIEERIDGSALSQPRRPACSRVERCRP